MSVKNAMPPLLDIRNATVFRGENRVFNGLSIRVEQGENLAILGPNGCGKTTLLKLLGRELYPVVKPDSYVKLFGSETVNIWKLREKVGLVSEDLQARYTACTRGIDVVLSGFFGAVGHYEHLRATPEQRLIAQKAIDDVGLREVQERMFHHLSSWQQRRFLLARAMIHNPGTLVFDEPTNSLDIHASFQLLLQLRDLCRRGVSVILATHHVNEILPEVSRVVLMKQGEVVADGEKSALLTSERLSDLYEVSVAVTEQRGFYQVFPGC
ncbi:MAG: ATP-binding cassette domain-containing protein [Exilibacterium sp.]